MIAQRVAQCEHSAYQTLRVLVDSYHLLESRTERRQCLQTYLYSIVYRSKHVSNFRCESIKNIPWYLKKVYGALLVRFIF